jgi:hypothetical protein
MDAPEKQMSLPARQQVVLDQIERVLAAADPRLLFWCGEDKIVYASETPVFHPQWALEPFWDFSLPEDLCACYGYPQLTEQAKRKILGENLLRLHHLDVTETRARLGKPQGRALSGLADRPILPHSDLPDRCPRLHQVSAPARGPGPAQAD